MMQYDIISNLCVYDDDCSSIFIILGTFGTFPHLLLILIIFGNNFN